MKCDSRNAVALIAGLALYQLMAPKIEHLRGLATCHVRTLSLRAMPHVVTTGRRRHAEVSVKDKLGNPSGLGADVITLVKSPRGDLR